MDALYNGAVGYERMKSYIGSFVSGLLGVGIIICAIFSFATSLSSSSTTNPKKETNTPSDTNTSSGWIFLCICGVILLVISTGLYYMATSTSKTTEHILAAQGAFDATSTIFSLFNHKRGGYFMEGE